MKPYRAAVIGRTGRGNYGHDLDQAWLGLPNVTMVAIADEDAAGREQALRRTGALRGYEDYRQMLSCEQPDFVSVAPRWLDCHAEMMLACIEAGVRGILCEKPFVRTPAEADAVLEAAQRAGTQIAVAHQSRVLPHIHRAREMVRRGDLGQVHTLIGHGKGDHRGGGEDLWVLGTHTLDLMRFLAGDPAWVSACVQVEGREITRSDVYEGGEQVGPIAGDSIWAMYAFPNGITGLYESHRNQGGSGGRFGLEIHGSEGILVIRPGEGFEVRYFPQSYAPTRNPVEWQRLPMPEWESAPRGLAWANQILARDLVAAVEEDRNPISSGADGRWAVEMILGVYAAQLAGSRVSLPLADRRHPLAPESRGRV